jgi:hypothetical protein
VGRPVLGKAVGAALVGWPDGAPVVGDVGLAEGAPVVGELGVPVVLGAPVLGEPVLGAPALGAPVGAPVAGA